MSTLAAACVPPESKKASIITPSRKELKIKSNRLFNAGYNYMNNK